MEVTVKGGVFILLGILEDYVVGTLLKLAVLYLTHSQHLQFLATRWRYVKHFLTLSLYNIVSSQVTTDIF